MNGGIVYKGSHTLFSMCMEHEAEPGRQLAPVTKEMGKADSKL